MTGALQLILITIAWEGFRIASGFLAFKFSLSIKDYVYLVLPQEKRHEDEKQWA